MIIYFLQDGDFYKKNSSFKVKTNIVIIVKMTNQAVHMLQYLPTDTFSELEGQNTSHILMKLKEAIVEIYINNEQGTGSRPPSEN